MKHGFTKLAIGSFALAAATGGCVYDAASGEVVRRKDGELAGAAEACNKHIAAVYGPMLVAPRTMKMMGTDSVWGAALNPSGRPVAPANRRRVIEVHTSMDADNRMGVPLRTGYRCVAVYDPEISHWSVVESGDDGIIGMPAGMMLDTVTAQTPGQPPAPFVRPQIDTVVVVDTVV